MNEIATTAVKQLTFANVTVIEKFAVELQVDELGKTFARFQGNAEEVMNRIDKLRSNWDGRSFENRAIVAVRNKLRDYTTGGRYAKYVVEHA